MLSDTRCRELLGPGCDLNDDEIRALRDQLYCLARLALESAEDEGRRLRNE